MGESTARCLMETDGSLKGISFEGMYLVSHI